MHQADEVTEHRALLRQRIADRNLSRIELRDEMRQRRALITNPVAGIDPEIINAELAELGDMLQERMPPERTPEQVVEDLKQTNPAASLALEYQLAVNKLTDSVAQAQDQVDTLAKEGRTSQPALDNLAALEARLAEHPPPPMQTRYIEIQELKSQAENLRLQSTVALTDNDRDTLLSSAEALLSQARELRSPSPQPANEDTAAAIAAGEALVEQMQQAGNI
jgi:hypothetical protein